LAFITSYDWPGNVRELKNLGERIAVMNRRDRIGLQDLMELFQKHPGQAEKDTNGAPGAVQNPLPQDILSLNYDEARGLFEKYYLGYQLAQNKGKIAWTAEAIGIYPSTLHAKLRKYGLRTER
jgi:two-component system nitrogen regulation response regulator NtrX